MREAPSAVRGVRGHGPPLIFFSPRMQNGAIWGLFFFRPLFLNSRTFIKTSEFRDFSRPGIFHFNFQDFSRIPGPVGTLYYTLSLAPYHSNNRF